MTFHYSIDPQCRLITQRHEGRLTLTELLDGIQRMWDDPAYSTTYDGIVDLTDASFDVSLADFHALMGFLKNQEKLSRGRWALVTASPLATACGLLYRQMVTQHTLEIFCSRDDVAGFPGSAVDRSMSTARRLA